MEGHIQTLNRAFLNLLQAEKHQVCNRPFIEFVYADDRGAVSETLLALQVDHSPSSFVCRYLCYDDSIKWHLWTIYPSVDSCMHAVGRDITPYKQMESKEHERNIFAEALLDTVLAINSSLALDQVLARILSNIGKVVSYEYVSILLVESDRAEVVGTQHIAQNHQATGVLQGKKFSIKDNRYLHHMFQTRESIIVPEIEQAPAWIAASEASVLGGFLGAPIIVEEEVIGFLCVFNVHREFFTPLHAQQLITFANQAGLAINNARLYEQAQSAAVLRERQRMAQELHDSVNQDLFAASTYADLLPKAITRKPEVLSQYAFDISNLIRRAVDQMRMILIELHPDTLKSTCLEVLIQQACNVFSRQTGIVVDLNRSNSRIILEEKIQIAIYRIVQECLHNIDKHASASRVKVMLQLSDTELLLEIKDDGVGFDPSTINELHFGISSIQERAHNIDADMTIESKIGQGTIISLRKISNGNYKANPDYPSG